MNFINCYKSFDEIQSEWEYIFRNNHYQDNIFFNFFDFKKNLHGQGSFNFPS